MDALLKQTSKNKFYFRVRQNVKDAIAELVDILNTVGFSESQKNQVLTDQILTPFFKTIFHYEEDMNQKTRLRLLTLSQTLIDILGHLDFAQKLTPDLYQIVMDTMNEKEPMVGIKAIYLTREWRAFRKIAKKTK